MVLGIQRAIWRKRPLFNRLNRALDAVLSLAGVCSIVMILLLAAFVSFQAILRSGLNINITGLFDLSMYALLAFPFLTAAYTLREGKHIVVDVFTSLLPERASRGLDVGVYLVSLIFPIILGWKAGEWAYEAFGSGAMTIAVLVVPKGIFIAIIALGSLLLSLQIIRRLIHSIRFLASSEVPGQVASPGLRANPLVYISLVIVGVVICLILFNNWNAAASLVIVTLFLLFCGMPVFLTLGLIGCFGLYFLGGSTTLMLAPLAAYKAMFSFPLTCLPLFILGGMILERGKIVDRLFTFFELWSGRFSPSLLIATIASGGVFCAISGSSVAATAVIAAVALPLLISRGYSRRLSCGVVAGATVGTLIPPSISFVVYGVLTEESIGQLFMAAIIPGAVLFSFYFLYIIILSIVNKKALFEKGEIPSDVSAGQISWKDRFIALRDAAFGLLTPVIVLGGIYMGTFTPTEAGGVLVVYAIILCVFITRTLKWRDLLAATLRSAQISSMILCIIFSAYIFALVISQLQMAAGLVAWATATGLGAVGVLGLIFITLFILGMFIDAPPIKVMTLPLFYPLAMGVGINGLWLGVFYIINHEIGALTPPMGLNLFAIRGASGIPLGTIIRGVLPFILMMMLTLVVLYFFPQLVTWLPSTMFGD